MQMMNTHAGKLLLQACPEVGSMSGTELVTALGKGSEMRKAWEGGSGGSNRLVQCLLSQGQACLVYGRGWLRKSVQHPIDRYPATSVYPLSTPCLPHIYMSSMMLSSS